MGNAIPFEVFVRLVVKFSSDPTSVMEVTWDSPCGTTVKKPLALWERPSREMLTNLADAGENGASGAITQMPILGNIKNPFGDVQDTAVGPDRYGHGYYKAVTGSNITVELRASNHSGIYQYTFPAEHTANVIVDISHVFQPSQGQELTYKAGAFEVLSDRSYKGTGHYIGRNESAHNVSFCGYFDNAVDGK